MTVARLYILHAVEGRAAQMEAALEGLADVVRKAAGSEGVEVLRDLGNEHRFIFIEKWESEEAHGAALGSLPPGTIDPVQAASDGPPDGSYYDYVKTV